MRIGNCGRCWFKIVFLWSFISKGIWSTQMYMSEKINVWKEQQVFLLQVGWFVYERTGIFPITVMNLNIHTSFIRDFWCGENSFETNYSTNCNHGFYYLNISNWWKNKNLFFQWTMFNYVNICWLLVVLWRIVSILGR